MQNNYLDDIESDFNINYIIASMPGCVYWKDLNSVYRGCNINLATISNLKSPAEIVGKTDFDFEWGKLSADEFREQDAYVMTTGKTHIAEQDVYVNSEIRSFRTEKKPLIGKSGKVIGVFGFALDITAEKEAEALKLIELERQRVLFEEQLKVSQIIDSANASIYWKDEKGEKYLGCNQYVLNMIGLKSRDEIIGKTDFDFLLHDEAQKLSEINRYVLANGRFEGEESFRLPNGEYKTYFTVKTQLTDSKGNILGLVGTSIDITAQKEVERLKAERHQFELQEQERSRKTADQVAHDIRSPIASMLMIIRACEAIPERERIALREATTTINDIANNLLSKYEKETSESDRVSSSGQREETLISPALVQLLTEKKYQYQNLPVKFDHQFTQSGNFAWIKVDVTAFKRMLSNLINNAVDAFDQKEGKITVYLTADAEHVSITIEDNGKGMTPGIRQKILNDIAVTEGKEDGHGIGLTQVRETLKANQGQWDITSEVGVGTQVVLTFPRARSQNWLAETIPLKDDDTVVIVDDDSSIHMAWDTRFDTMLKEFPNLRVKHFDMGREAISFINGLSADKKTKVFLLTDYELLKQNLNGLDIIEETNTKRAVLVTSHYANKEICQAAVQCGAKILPKQLASDIPIDITPNSNTNNEQSKADIVFVDDDTMLLKCVTLLAKNTAIDTYDNPHEFLDNAAQYAAHTHILVDNNFNGTNIKGIQILEQLHPMGFANLYLLSGDNFRPGQLPSYITVIPKTDIEPIARILKSISVAS